MNPFWTDLKTEMMRPGLGSSYLRMSLNKIFSMVDFHNTHVFPIIKHAYMIALTTIGALAFVGGATVVKFHIGNLTYTGGAFSRAVLGAVLGYMTGVALAYTYPIAFPLAVYAALGGHIAFRIK